MRAKRRKRLSHYRKVERAAQQRARSRIRNAIYGIKMMFGCARCPEMHPAALHFHHKNPKKKLLEIRMAVSQKVPFWKILKEIEKCVVLCANCHAKEHYENRT